MGYYDAFYIVENIIGFTGETHNNPTVYFESDGGYGRITQDHPDKGNIGRGPVFVNEGHSMANENYMGSFRLVERVGGEVKHFSRNKFVTLEGLPQTDKDLLCQAIWRHTELKEKFRGKVPQR